MVYFGIVEQNISVLVAELTIGLKAVRNVKIIDRTGGSNPPTDSTLNEGSICCLKILKTIWDCSWH